MIPQFILSTLKSSEVPLSPLLHPLTVLPPSPRQALGFIGNARGILPKRHRYIRQSVPTIFMIFNEVIFVKVYVYRYEHTAFHWLKIPVWSRFFGQNCQGSPNFRF
jgi:hypothetical protein